MFEKELFENDSSAESQTDISPATETAAVILPKKTIGSKKLPLPFEPEDAGTELVTIPIREINEHDELLIRNDYDSNEISHLEQKIRLGWNDLSPIVVVMIGTIYYLVDGVYRWLASKKAGITEVKARVINGSIYDAFLYRARINCNQGIPLTIPEKDAIVRRILENAIGWNYADNLISFITSVSDKKVSKIRRTDFPHKTIPVIRTAFKNGKLTQVDTSKIGKKKSKKQPPGTAPANQTSIPLNDNSISEASVLGTPPLNSSVDIEVINHSENNSQAAGQNSASKLEDEVDYDPNLAAKAQERKQVEYGDVFVVESLILPGKPHIIACLDATIKDLVLKLFCLFKAGLLITDLPYNRNLKTKIGIGEVAHELHKIANDNLSPSGYRRLIRTIFQTCRQNLEEGSGFFVFYGLHETMPTFHFINGILGAIRKQIVWNKKGLRQNWSPDFRDGQECAYFGNTGEKLRYWSAPKKNRTTMFNEVDYYKSPWELPPLTHPCPKPIPILADFINLTLEPGEAVFDPMMGSGSTVVAAEVTGRRGVGTEIVRAFVAVTLERFENKKHRWIRTSLDELPNVLRDIEKNGWPEKEESNQEEAILD